MCETSQDTNSLPVLLHVQTFTARYDPIEDRIFLNTVDATGAKQVIYLTRRLMDQIIPVLAKHLEDKTPKGVPPDVVQSMTQERVRRRENLKRRQNRCRPTRKPRVGSARRSR